MKHMLLHNGRCFGWRRRWSAKMKGATPRLTSGVLVVLCTKCGLGRGHGVDKKSYPLCCRCVVTAPAANVAITNTPSQLHRFKLSPPLPDHVVLSHQASDFRKHCFAMDPDERLTAGDLRKHPYLLLPLGWEFAGYS